MADMSTETMGLETEVAYRQQRFLAEAEADRLAHAVRGTRPLDRLVDWVRNRRRRVVAARGATGQHAWR